MPTRRVELTKELDAFVEEVVRNGSYPNADAAMRDAVSGLQTQMEMQQKRRVALQTELAKGLQGLESGNFVEIDDNDLDRALDEFTMTTDTSGSETK